MARRSAGRVGLAGLAGVAGVAALAGLGLLLRPDGGAAAPPRPDPEPPGDGSPGGGSPAAESLEVTSTDGTVLNVRLHGRPDAPIVVLAHGWTCSIDFWAAQIAALAPDFRVVAYDQRGHGSSAPAGPAGYTMDALADDLRAVLDATVPAGRPAVLAGHSMGGFATLALAGRHPRTLADRVAAVLMANTSASDLSEPAYLPPGAPAWLRRAAAAVSRYAVSSTMPTGPAGPLSRRFLRYLALSPGATDEQVAFCENIVRACSRHTRGACGAELARMDLSAAVGRLDVPAVVLIGRADRLIAPAASRRLAAGLPKLVELVELPGVGHMTPVETPATVTALIRRLAERHR